VLIACVSGAASFGGSLAVYNYRTNQNEASIGELKQVIRESVKQTNDRLDAMDRRLNEMSKGAVDTARLEEQNRALAAQIMELKNDLRETSGKNDARYDNLSTRLARQGF
jgi:hypothetical protein